MGLDSFAQYNGKAMDSELFTDLNLCGGVFSDGQVSIRGKVYDQIVHHVTGVSLYQEEIPNNIVKNMAERMESFVKSGDVYYTKGYRDYKIQELRDLSKWFRIIADNNGYIVGWW